MAPLFSDLASERRFFSSELRTSTRTPRTIEGYAARFNSLSQNLGGFRERIAPGCFSRSLAAGVDVRCLQNHDVNLILGRVSNGTLSLEQDRAGLHFRCDLPDTSYARDLYALVNRRDISQCSFGFVVRADDWSDCDPRDPDFDPEDPDCRIRTLRDVDLMDVSVVTQPAYEDTNVLARAAFPNGMPNEVRSVVNRWQQRRDARQELQEFQRRQRLLRAIL